MKNTCCKGSSTFNWQSRTTSHVFTNHLLVLWSSLFALHCHQHEQEGWWASFFRSFYNRQAKWMFKIKKAEDTENLLNPRERWILAAPTQSSTDCPNSVLMVFWTLHTFIPHCGLITLEDQLILTRHYL